jgi:hypothetical protein
VPRQVIRRGEKSADDSNPHLILQGGLIGTTRSPGLMRSRILCQQSRPSGQSPPNIVKPWLFRQNRSSRHFYANRLFFPVVSLSHALFPMLLCVESVTIPQRQNRFRASSRRARRTLSRGRGQTTHSDSTVPSSGLILQLARSNHRSRQPWRRRPSARRTARHGD